MSSRQVFTVTTRHLAILLVVVVVVGIIYMLSGSRPNHSYYVEPENTQACPRPFQNDGHFLNEWVKTYKKGPGLDKWVSYFHAYERHFGRYVGHDVVMVEIGVQSGGSTKMWRAFFGEKLRYFGLDVNRHTQQFQDPANNIEIHFVDQGDRDSLRKVIEKLPKADIILDDGSHFFKHQINTFEVMFPYLKEGGVYCCEDTHTSYFAEEFDGAVNKEDSFVEYAKSLVDVVHYRHIANDQKNQIKYLPKGEKLVEMFNTIGGFSWYDSMLFIEKVAVPSWDRVKGGDIWIPYYEHDG